MKEWAVDQAHMAKYEIGLEALRWEAQSRYLGTQPDLRSRVYILAGFMVPGLYFFIIICTRHVAQFTTIYGI